MKASLKNYGQSPRKTRLVADVVRGRRVKEALGILAVLNKRAAAPIAKLLRSAVANAASAGARAEHLVVDHIAVDKGVVYKRMMPRARGASSPIFRRTSHVEVRLSEKKSGTRT